jgi:mannan endo-1,4-beta-mannosidase
MKTTRRPWPLLIVATAVVLLSACSAVSQAAYPYRLAHKATHSYRAAHKATHPDPPPTPAPPAAPAPPGPLPVGTASYWGIYEPGAPASYGPVEHFTALMGGEAPQIDLYFSDWGEPFQTAYARTALDHEAVTLVQLQPTDVSLAAIAAGRFDGYLRSYAQQVRAFGDPVIIGFAHEMNGFWYSWGYGHVSPSTWVAAWRHVVTVFRQQGADNVTWLWTVNIMDPPGIPAPSSWWPGSAYVTWVGIDGYYLLADDSFQGVLGPTIAEVRGLTDKPILIAETGIGTRDVPAAMPGLIAGIRQSHLLGLVWFDAAGSPNWRLEGHPAALGAFRRGIAAMLASSLPPESQHRPA